MRQLSQTTKNYHIYCLFISTHKDAFFLVGKGNSPHANGIKVADESGRSVDDNV